ncbi:MAG: TIM barrel protein [Acidobacteria bacterium]|nr:TIM barrel protein [Acidobacteriota bacterium]
MNRRSFLAAAIGAGAAAASTGRMEFCVFSKHLQFLSWAEMAAAAKEMGFDGIDLTVRKGGHVTPDRVNEDLPKASEAIRAAGSKLTMITTDITDMTTSYAQTVLRAAKGVGVTHYRWDGYKYKEGVALPEQLKEFAPRVKELAAFNKELGLCAMYHTHSGAGRVGASQWDLWMLLRDLDKRYVSYNFDVAHATVEGGLGGWLHATRLAMPHMGGIALKDFLWGKGPNGKWRVDWCPIGEGMVQTRDFLKMAKSGAFNGPVQVHYEYGLGGAEKGATKITIAKADVLKAMKRDLDALRKAAAEAGWA